MKQRADLALFGRGLAKSREAAQALILEGRVYIDEKRVDKASDPVEEGANLLVRGDMEAWASRGAHKIEKALDAFGIDVRGVVAMDIGAASGGFTDVLLRRGASHVYAIDVGYGQLEWRLRQDPRVTVMERTNARTLTPAMFPLQPTFTVMDVSFISVRLVIPAAAAVMGDAARFAVLIKPQFEAGRGEVGKNGVVREEGTHIRVLAEIRDFMPGIGLHLRALEYSPIKGPKGNIEFLADIRRGEGAAVPDGDITALVRRARADLG
ncbi:MAG TPA: TlyA family RNA methyltransferase [Candidatus Limnocylindria bacterium]|nr:TlyA family RNA methyltransferase [Candidatus Limnocylindria bacterium]